MSRRGRRRGGDDVDADGWTRGFEMVLHIPGAPGDSELEGHNQWINLLAWSWGLSRSRDERKKPPRILAAIAAKKKEIVKKAKEAQKQKKQMKLEKKKAKNIAPTPICTGEKDVLVLQEIENNSGTTGSEQKANACASANQHDGAQQTTADINGTDDDGSENENEHQIAEEALANYDSDNDEDNQFDDNEVALNRRSRHKSHMQDLSLTKYVDIASPLLMLKCLSKEGAFDCTMRICKRREVKKPKDDSDLKTDSKEDDKLVEKTKRSKGTEDQKSETDTKEEEKKEFEAVVVEEFLLQDCYIGSVSTGGSGGEDRLTENITIGFSRIVRTYTDHLGNAPRGARGEVPTKTMYYDALRHKAMALDQAVANAIEDQRKLAPVSTLLLDYLNLRAKPTSAAQ